MARNRWMEEMYTIDPKKIAQRDKEYNESFCWNNCGYQSFDKDKLFDHEDKCNYIDYDEDL